MPANVCPMFTFTYLIKSKLGIYVIVSAGNMKRCETSSLPWRAFSGS